jgi:hypothetical protein
LLLNLSFFDFSSDNATYRKPNIIWNFEDIAKLAYEWEKANFDRDYDRARVPL